MTETTDKPWTDEQRQAYFETLPTYQRYDAMAKVREAARMLAKPGDKVIYRDAFRWKDDADDFVMSNHYEMFELEGLAADFGYTIVHNFKHVAVVRRTA